MATQFGSITEFQPDTDAVKAYLERVNLYFSANDVPEAKQVPILLSSIGASTYALLSDLLAPDAPGTKSFTEISTALRQHFEPKRAVIAERFHFYKRDQASGESVAAFDAVLRNLATHCDFGEFLEQALRDRFVCGLARDSIQRRLLSEINLIYTKAVETEAADTHTKSFKDPEPIHKFYTQRAPLKQKAICYRCGRPNHSAEDCRFKTAECHNCGKQGHIASVCRSRRTPRGTQAQDQSNVPTNYMLMTKTAMQCLIRVEKSTAYIK